MLVAILLTTLSADIEPGNVNRLGVAWTRHTGATAPNPKMASRSAFEATPVLAGNLLFIATPFHQVLALGPGTGAVRWQYDPVVAKQRDYSEVTSRGVA